MGGTYSLFPYNKPRESEKTPHQARRSPSCSAPSASGIRHSEEVCRREQIFALGAIISGFKNRIQKTQNRNKGGKFLLAAPDHPPQSKSHAFHER